MKYTSKFPNLSFYVEGERKYFSNGIYETTDKAAIAVLDAIKDVKKEAAKPAAKNTIK